MVDSDLRLTAHVNHVTSVCYYHIRQLRLLRRSLSFDAVHALVRALVHSKLDYCNGILGNAPKGLINSLQSVLRSAARLVLRLSSCSSVTQLLRNRLHWLPVEQRVTFKLCTLAYKCINGLAPSYLANMCLNVSSVPGRARLRSAVAGELIVPDTAMATVGRRGFYYSAPAAWNALPTKLRSSTSLSLQAFKGQLKTFLFI
jgi:hypothetical protein